MRRRLSRLSALSIGRWFGALGLVVAATIVSVSYLTGWLGERALRGQWDLQVARLAQSGYTLSWRSLDRGVLRSEFRFELVHRARPDQTRIQVTVDIRHGPLLHTPKGWRLGMVALFPRLSADSRLANLPKGIDAAEWLAPLWGLGLYDQQYELHWALPEIQISFADTDLELDRPVLFWRGDYQTLRGAGELDFDFLRLTTPQKSRLEAESTLWRWSLDSHDDWLLTGASRWHSDVVRWRGDGVLPIDLAHVSGRWDQTLDEHELKARLLMTVDRVSGVPVPLSDLNAEWHLRGLTRQVFAKWQRDASKFTHATLQSPLPWLASVDDLLARQLSADARIQANLGEGQIKASSTMNYQGVKGMHTWQWPAWWARWQGDVQVHLASEALLRSPFYGLIAPVLEQWTQSDGRVGRTFKVRWEQGEWRRVK